MCHALHGERREQDRQGDLRPENGGRRRHRLNVDEHAGPQLASLERGEVVTQRDLVPGAAREVGVRVRVELLLRELLEIPDVHRLRHRTSVSGRPERAGATLAYPRRGGRAVECGGLENRFGLLGPTRVQIPPPPLNWAESRLPSGCRRLSRREQPLGLSAQVRWNRLVGGSGLAHNWRAVLDDDHKERSDTDRERKHGDRKNEAKAPRADIRLAAT